MKMSLNSSWMFIKDYTSLFNNEILKNGCIISLPHTVEKVPLNYLNDQTYQTVSAYQKQFNVTIDPKKSYYLDLEGFMLQADIYLNDIYLGHYISGFLPVKIDITDKVKGQNILTIILDSREDKNIPPFGFIVDYFTFGGIYRDVNLIIKDKLNIDDAFVTATIDGKVNVDVKINNPANCQYSLKYLVKNNEGSVIKESNSAEFLVNDIKLWNINEPNLYLLEIHLKSEEYEDIKQIRFGFRKAEFKKDGFYLNNKKIKLIGLNRHQVYPYVGYAAPKLLQEDDAITLKKDIGINIVRTSHYPQSEYFLDKCDEIGLLVIDEVPGWQHIGIEKEWRETFYNFIERMVLKERNHTSLIGYGVRIDESQDDHELYSKANQIVHTLDNTRQTLGVRNFKKSECLEDIYAYNDFTCCSTTHGLDDPRKSCDKDKPYIISEHDGHMFSTKPTDSSSDRLTQALRHATVINDAYKYERVSACIGWCFVDYYTHGNFGSGDHICYHGVMDINRNPKFAASIYKSQLSNDFVMDILSNLDAGDNAENLPGLIYIATNLDYIKLYKGDKYINTFYPDKSNYKYLPHPLVVINDFIGKTFNEPRFKEKDYSKFVYAINTIRNIGIAHMDKKTKLYLVELTLKYHLQYKDIVDLYNRYVTDVDYLTPYIFEGYSNGQLVVVKKVGVSKTYHIEISSRYKSIKLTDNYEIIPVKVKYVDEYNNVMPYIQTPIQIRVEGPIELVSDPNLPLIGGMQTILVKTSQKEGIGRIIVNFQNQEKVYEIKLIK